MTTLGPGATVDRYRLVAPAGEGGQGSVWRAEDPLHPGDPVALKLVPLNAAPPASVERFRREARALSRLAHPSLPRCHALFEDLRHDVVGIALDFIEGSPLSVLMASETLTTAHRVWVLRHLARALGYIHEAGLVHRDVKPQNVMIGKGFTTRPEDPAGVKLVDFGIAAEPDNPQPLTVTGSVIGTNEFLAPEIIDRTFWKESTDGPERDVFALGVLGFELLHGRHPAGIAPDAPLGDFMLAYREHADKGTWPPGVAGDPLEAFYRAALALRPSQRAPNGAALEALLDESQTGSPAVTSRPASRPVPSVKTAPVAALENARTEPAEFTKMTPSLVFVRRSYRVIAGLVVGGSALFALAFFAAYQRPFPSLAGPTRVDEVAGPAPTSTPRSLPTPTEAAPPDPPEPPLAPRGPALRRSRPLPSPWSGFRPPPRALPR